MAVYTKEQVRYKETAIAYKCQMCSFYTGPRAGFGGTMEKYGYCHKVGERINPCGNCVLWTPLVGMAPVREFLVEARGEP